MRKTIPAILSFIWLAVVACLAFMDGSAWSRQESMNLCQDGLQVENRFYIMDNREKEGVIYQIDESHQVTDMFLTGSYKENISIARLSYSDSLYVLVEEGEEHRIIKLDELMTPVEESRKIITKEEGEISSFLADDTGFYLTMVLPEGDQAVTYFAEKEEIMRSIPAPRETAALQEVTELQEEEEQAFLRMVRMIEAPVGRKIVDASFKEGDYQVRYDDGVGKEEFLLKEEILDAYYGRKLDLSQTLEFQKEQLIFYLELLVAGYAVLILGTILLRNRNHIVYTLVMVELVLLAITALGTGITYQVAEETVINQNKKFGVYYLKELKRQIGPNYKEFIQEESFYNSESYYQLLEKLEGFVKAEGPDELFHSLAVVRLEDNRVMVASNSKNREHVAYQYSTSVLPILEQIKDGGDNAAIQVWLEGKSHLVIAVADKEGLKSRYCYVGLLEADNSVAKEEEAGRFIYYGSMIFIVGSALCILLILFQERDLRKLNQTMVKMAKGDYEIQKETVHGKDVETMWNALLEIKKRISRINHAKFQLYESCYRFAPKNIEKILGRKSITEVQSGDAIELYGTLAMINTAKTFYMDVPTMHQVNSYIELMEKHKEDREVFFLSGNNNLKNMKMLFLQDCRDSSRFGINFMKEFQQMAVYDRFKAGILLHHDHYVYGVAGSDSQCFSFLFYQKMERLERLGYWLQQQGIKLVMTEAVKNREGIHTGVRYIGYILFEGEEKVNLYEVLDACSEEERKKKIALDAKFQKALELFYQYDFYLARSTFSEIIKENPEDQIAKWYLFTCQKYLNQSYSGEISFELWEKEE
ncbi:MAG: hypothetical protein IKW28_08200 [Lachnospiraceae bacterium]|nr:hypothetical protein [Lachnospiraceae bacterium]